MTHQLPAVNPEHHDPPKHGRRSGAGEGTGPLGFSLINSIANKILAFAKGPLATFLKVNYLGFWLVYRLGNEIGETFLRVIVKVVTLYIAALRRWTANQLAALRALVWRLYYQLLHLIHYSLRLAFDYTRRLVRIEALARRRAVAAAEAKARAEVRQLHQVIEREAASAYRQGLDARLSLIQHLAGMLARFNPEVRHLLADLVGGVLDLASVDDPLARLVLGFLMKQVIDRLGIDKAAGDLVSALLAPLLGDPKPHDLHDVVLDISKRLQAMEQQWSTFFADGGSQVEQAGEQWQQLQNPVLAAALLANFGAAAADPTGWARTVADVIGPVTDGILIGAADLIRKV